MSTGVHGRWPAVYGPRPQKVSLFGAPMQSERQGRTVTSQTPNTPSVQAHIMSDAICSNFARSSGGSEVSASHGVG